MLVDRILDAAPGVRLVITSQTPLHLRRERVLVLGPLALPSEDTVASVTQSAAGQLLLSNTGSGRKRDAHAEDRRAAGQALSPPAGLTAGD